VLIVALIFDIGDTRVTMGVTPNRACRASRPKRDSLRSTPVGAIWPALPGRDRNLLVWLLAGDIVTASLAALLVYGNLRTAQRRLARLTELEILRGFWAAGTSRPRGRHAYVLTRRARADIERIVWPTGRPGRRLDLPPSAAIHQLATHDLLAAFLQAGDALLREGLFAWIPERAAARLFDGYLRPDAVAGIRIGDRATALFVERDLGTERGDDLPDKIGRYRAVFARAPELPINVGFVVESERRARTIQKLATSHRRPGSPRFLTAVSVRLVANPMGLIWTDGETRFSTRDLASIEISAACPILTSGCLADVDAVPAMDDRALAMIPALHQYLA